ncbi:PepSY-associated TM helix domain-containing protein [Methylosarcina fibrata]|uniref:PepSY-associated TM helix domain-containing protein n=1 Tax=Methylosarcina fibrata TaxID=105972 RepID=UPI000379921F|nr:PepSY-associated TM helix domain-containing protein [Methylosarcina fibrata]
MNYLANNLATKSNRLERLKSRRKLWLQVHLWLGLFVGGMLVIISLTGSVLVFWQEIDEWLNRDLMRVEIPKDDRVSYRPLSEIEASVKSSLPEDAKPGYGYHYPRHERGVFVYWYALPGQNQNATHTLFINPYTAEVTGDRVFYSSESPFRHRFIGFIFKLHYGLLLKDTGITLVGILAALSLVSLLSGLIVWWPLTGKWAQAFTVKRRASVERLNFDLHKTFGIYSMPVLGTVLLSGVYFNLPQQFDWLVKQASPETRVRDTPPPQSSMIPGIAPIGLERAVTIAEAAFPGGRWHLLKPPDGKHGVYALTRIDVPDLSWFWSERTVTVDQYSGKILQVRAPDVRRSPGESFLDWQWPLHSGQAFGWCGRILVFLSGLACPVLFITGFVRWRQKKRAERRHSNKFVPVLYRETQLEKKTL